MRRAQRRKYHYIYKTTCKVTEKYYYGMHSTDNLNDGYLGSGKRLWYSLNKHGRGNHICEKLEFFDNREKLKNREKEIINKDFIKDSMCMNLQIGGGGGFTNEEHKQKFLKAGTLAAAKSGKNIQNTIKKLKWLRENDKEWLERYRNSFKGLQTWWNEKKHSEETKEKMRLTHNKNKHQKGSKNSQYGTHWITDEKESKKINKENNIPKGWKLGRKMKFVL